MIEHSLVTLAIVIVTLVISYKGFTNRSLMEGYSFDVDKVLIQKDYIRFISAGFLHVSWLHLIFNMITLLAFGGILEPMLGIIKYLLVYFVSMVGGNMFALLVHKNNGDYSSVGASGAINGIIFSLIVLYPNMGIGFFFIPVSIPAWVFGVVYMLFTLYGI